MRDAHFLPSIDRDGRLVIAASAIRALGYGFLSVFLGVYVSLLGFTPLQAGLVFSGIMAGGALSNAVATWKGDTIGRRRMLVAMSALMVLGGALFPLASAPVLLAIIGLFAMTTTTGGDRTAFLSLDTAILAQTADSRGRTAVFTWYNLTGVGARSLGVLLIAVPATLQSWLGIGELASFKAMFGAYSVIAIGGILLYARLSPAVEPEKAPSAAIGPSQPRKSRATMLRLSGLFSLDALGGGFMVNSYISFWFASRFGVDLTSIAGIFFAGQVLNAASIFLAAPLAYRIGLVNTMTSTQVVSNLMMVAMALMGNLWGAVAFYLTRELANDMDLPTRQSYMMAITPPEAMTTMASVTNLSRNLSQTVSPGIAGYVAQSTFLGAPFLIGSGIKLVYNVTLYFLFRGIKPPEEVASDAGSLPAALGHSEVW